MYFFSYGDEFVTTKTSLSFCPYNQAHRINSSTTRQWANALLENIKKENDTKLFDCNGPFGVPFKPLIGIKAPAIALEIGLKEKTDWHHYTHLIAKSLEPVVKR